MKRQETDSQRCFLQRIYSICLMFLVLALSACAGGYDHSENTFATVRSDEGKAVQPVKSDAVFSRLDIPADVDVNSFTAFKLSVDGKVLVGTASPQVTAFSAEEEKHVFRWNLDTGEWLWLEKQEYEDSAAVVGIDSHANHIFGSQWVWSSDRPEVRSLPSDFWAYVLRDDGYFLGAGLNSVVVMMSVEGKSIKSWAAKDIFNLDDRGNVKDNVLLADSGVAISSTVEQCLLDDTCTQAHFNRWTPEQGTTSVIAELPERPDGFFQSSDGAQQLSQNGEWLVGSVGQGLYLWDAQGDIRFLGGFYKGGTVISLSNDGKMVVGYAVDEKIRQERAWIWTETEGLGWLDEWLRDHGVASNDLSQSMQIKLLSADRRVMIGFTPSSGSGGQSVWWRVELPEALRVLM